MIKKKWLSPQFDENLLADLEQQLPELSQTVLKIFIRRGFKDADKIRRFLYGKLSDLSDPFLLPDMPKAVNRIREALAKQEKVLIYGDYDVDGITSVSLLLLTLRFLGLEAEYYLPHRLLEGYGLHEKALSLAAERGIKLIITVDCGVASLAEARLAREKGMDLIITDHHNPGFELPEAIAVINAKRTDSRYPFKELAGVGVAYKLASALVEGKNEAESFLAGLREIAALGTIADIVSLLGENRILVSDGLQQITRSRFLFWQALSKYSGMQGKVIDTTAVGFVFAPRLNALGRLCSEELSLELKSIIAAAPTFSAVGVNPTCLGVELLTAKELSTAEAIAEFLESENKRRKKIGDDIFEEAKRLAYEFADKPIIVLAGDNWHLGVIGIVASKLVEEYYKPVILLSRNNGCLKGSARSIKGFHLFKALQQQAELLENYGGHELAAGLTLMEENLPAFRSSMERLAAETLTEEDFVPLLPLDLTDIDLDDLSFDLLEELNALAPYGQDNPQPLLSCLPSRLVEYSTMGQDASHLRLKVRTGTLIVDGVWFKHGDCCLKLSKKKEYRLAFTLNRNDYFRNNPKLQLCLNDLQEVGEEFQETGFWVTSLPFKAGMEELKLGESLNLKMISRKKTLVLDKEGHELGVLPLWLQKRIYAYLQKEEYLCCWAVALRDNLLQIGLELKNFSSSQEYAHLALPLWRIGRLIYRCHFGNLPVLYGTAPFYRLYSKFFTKEKKEPEENIFKVKDLREKWTDLLVKRDFLAFLYCELKKRIPQEKREENIFLQLSIREIEQWLKKAGRMPVNSVMIRAGLDLLEEMELLDRELDGGKQLIFCLPKPAKRFDLASLPRYLEEKESGF